MQLRRTALEELEKPILTTHAPILTQTSDIDRLAEP
jgi:hypothetical protein